MPLPDMEDPAWNRRRESLEKDVQNSLLQLLDHMGWPGGITIPLNTLEVQIKIVPALQRGPSNAN